MELQDGKNIEKFLVGQVDRPIGDREYQKLALEKGEGDIHRGVRRIRDIISQTLNLESQMEKVRKHQETYRDKNGIEKRTDPTNPHRQFARNFIEDIEMALEDLIAFGDGRYETRLFTASGSLLDYAGPFDFWVELYDRDKKIPIANYKIDIKTKPNEEPRYLADAVYYFDPKYIVSGEDGKDRVDLLAYEEPLYQYLVKQAAQSLRERSKIRLPS